MGILEHIPTSPPMPAVARILSRFDRQQLEGFLSVAIDLLDFADGDPDAENATNLEDDFVLTDNALHSDTGPGCAISDRDAGAYVEWSTMRGSQKRGPNLLAGQEDDEDDDQDACLAADDIGTASTPWHSSDGLPGDPADAEDGHDREAAY